MPTVKDRLAQETVISSTFANGIGIRKALMTGTICSAHASAPAPAEGEDRCGTYPPEVLIKPDIEDPDAFLVFTPGGTVEPRAGLSARDHLRASETIRILGLDGALNEIRRAELSGYLQTLEYFVEIADTFPEEEWIQELQQEVSNAAHLPYATAIRHVLTRQSE